MENGTNNTNETPKTINITPNFDNMFNGFFRDAIGALKVHGKKREITRKELYDFVSNFRIAIGSLTKAEQIEAVRKGFEEVGEMMYPLVMNDKCEWCHEDLRGNAEKFCNSDCRHEYEEDKKANPENYE